MQEIEGKGLRKAKVLKTLKNYATLEGNRPAVLGQQLHPSVVPWVLSAEFMYSCSVNMRLSFFINSRGSLLKNIPSPVTRVCVLVDWLYLPTQPPFVLLLLCGV